MNSLVNYIGKLALSIVLGVLFLVIVYALPVENMKANVARSSEIFNYEGLYPQMVSGYKYMQLDNFTDSLMLGAAIYDGEEGILDKAVNNYHIDSEQVSPELALTNYANEVSKYDYFAVSYGRYWHGYLVLLKLLLLFFDYADIRILNFFLQNILLFIIMKQFCRNHLEQYIPAFLVAVFLINPLTAALSLQFSSVYYIILFSTIYLLWLAEKGNATKEKTDRLFFITGILTAYFDFLTYPIAVFGMPVVLYLIIKKENIKMDSIKELLYKLMLWLGGYGGMWGGKWLAGSILIRRNLFRDALNQAMLHSSNRGGRFSAVIKNISVFLKWPFLIIFLIGVGYFFFRRKKSLRHRLQEQVVAIAIYVVIALLPVGWIFVMAEHSNLHYWFTCKEFAVSGFALLSLGTYLKNLDYYQKE